MDKYNSMGHWWFRNRIWGICRHRELDNIDSGDHNKREHLFYTANRWLPCGFWSFGYPVTRQITLGVDSIACGLGLCPHVYSNGGNDFTQKDEL